MHLLQIVLLILLSPSEQQQCMMAVCLPCPCRVYRMLSDRPWHKGWEA